MTRAGEHVNVIASDLFYVCMVRIAKSEMVTRMHSHSYSWVCEWNDESALGRLCVGERRMPFLGSQRFNCIKTDGNDNDNIAGRRFIHVDKLPLCGWFAIINSFFSINPEEFQMQVHSQPLCIARPSLFFFCTKWQNKWTHLNWLEKQKRAQKKTHFQIVFFTTKKARAHTRTAILGYIKTRVRQMLIRLCMVWNVKIRK